MNKQHNIPKHPLKFWWYIVRQYKWWMLAATSFVIVAQWLESIWPYLIKQITDSVTIESNHGEATKWIVGFGFTILFGGIMWRGSGFTGMQWITKSRARVTTELMEYLTHHSEAYFRDKFSGSLTNKIKNVTNGVGNLMETYLWSLLELAILLPISIFLSFQWSPIIGWAVVIWIIMVVPINFIFVKYKRKYSVEYAKTWSELTWQAVDIISNMSAVRQYVRRLSELLHIGKYIERHRLAHLKNWRISEWMLVTNDILQSLIFLGILALSAYLWRQGMFTGGDVLMMLNIGLMIEHRLMWIGNNINNIMDSYGEIHEGLEQIIVEYELIDDRWALPYIASGGNITFEDVGFAYGKKQVFENLSFSIPSWEKVGIVGESGAGKSTLVQLLLRQYDIQSGSIMFDGQDLRTLKQDSIREHIAYVPQDPALFHRTLRENIWYGLPNASDEGIIEAAKLAQAHDFIMELEEGYDTLVWERGVKLSWGQRQRVVIARAILKNAPILILDEATSALDSESEEKIQQALHELMKGKTVIAIAHRLSTIKDLDRVLVFEWGEIVEDGSHEKLAASDGVYGRLWSKQAGWFISD